MNKLIEWVIEIEGTASRIYKKAAGHFSDDSVFSEFLMGLSRDEQMHKNVIYEAIEAAGDKTLDSLAITLDDNTRKLVDSYFSLIEQKINAGTLTKDNMREVFNNILNVYDTTNHSTT